MLNARLIRWLVIGALAAATAVCLWVGIRTPRTAQPRITVAQATVLGLVEGLTEYVPVSSTGHLILAGHYMGLNQIGEHGLLGPKIRSTAAVSAFEVVIQLGAIIAVAGLYRRRVGEMVLGAVGRNPRGRRLLINLLIAVAPAIVIGGLFAKPIQEHLFNPVMVAIALVAGGAAMIAAEWWHRRKMSGKREPDILHITYWQALVIGLAQCLAMWPGTSRSMITIVAALMVGMNMVAAAEFSFLLALPTLGAATVYELAKNWSGLFSSCEPAALAVGLVVSAVSAAVAVTALVQWLTKHGLWPFGIYRIILGAAVYAYFMIRF
ncbi:MAG: undecaprenyl-diphosphate phosphatase [Planctomycetaceae bacterium]|nr:undecaprenyl-diphosphate phosphatase [Planctomycetaceae bacterium]